MAWKTSFQVFPLRFSCAICSSVIGRALGAVGFWDSKRATAIRRFPGDSEANELGALVDAIGVGGAGLDCGSAAAVDAIASMSAPRPWTIRRFMVAPSSRCFG